MQMQTTVHLYCNVAQETKCENFLQKFADIIPKLRPKGGGAVVGRVNREGQMTGYRLAYIYPGQIFFSFFQVIF